MLCVYVHTRGFHTTQDLRTANTALANELMRLKSAHERVWVVRTGVHDTNVVGGYPTITTTYLHRIPAGCNSSCQMHLQS